MFIAENELKIKVLGPKIDNSTFLQPILYLESGLVDNTPFTLKKKTNRQITPCTPYKKRKLKAWACWATPISLA